MPPPATPPSTSRVNLLLAEPYLERLLVTLVVMFAAVAPLPALRFGVVNWRSAVFLASAAACGGLLVLARRGRRQQACLGLFGMAIAVTLLVPTLAGGVGSPAYMILISVVMLAGMLFGLRQGVIALVAGALWGLALLAIELGGYLDVPARLPSPAQWVLVVGVAGALLIIYAGVDRARAQTEGDVRRLNGELERLVEERTQALAEATRYRDELDRLQRAILKSTTNFIIVTDADGVVQIFNPAAERSFGYRAEEVVGLATPMIWHDAREIALRAADLSTELRRPVQPDFEVFATLASHEAAGELVWTMLRRDGSRFPARLSVTPVLADGGALVGYLGLGADLTSEVQIKGRLRESETRLEFLLRHTPAVIFTCRPTDQAPLTSVNPSIERLLGYRPDAALAQADFWERALHPDDVIRFFDGLLRLRDVGAHQHTIRLRHQQGGYRWMQSGLSLIRDGEGHPREVVGYLIDVTATHEIEEMLRRQTAELSEINTALARANRMRDEFLASMSHELRTPLNVALGYAEALREEIYGALSDRQYRAVGVIIESSNELLRLINNILDYVRLQGGAEDLQIAPLEVSQLCQSLLASISPLTTERRLSVSLTLDPRLTSLNADSRRLRQALYNLLSNAVKFTPEGGAIGLEISRSPDDAYAYCTVWDTGIGIPPDKIKLLFRPFVQLDAGLARNYEGTGLGLALVACIADLHGGTVDITSAPGRGSRFTLALPLDRDPPATPVEQTLAGMERRS